MHLYGVMRILFFFLFELKDIFPTRAISLENDITKPLDKWISSVLTFAIDPIKEDNIFNRMMDHDRDFDNFDYSSKYAANHSEKKVIETVRFNALFNITRTSTSDESTSSSTDELLSSSAQVDFKFSSNEVRLLYKQLVLNGFGHLQENDNTYKIAFDAYLKIKNAYFNFTAFASSPSSNETNSTKISNKFSYSSIETKFKFPKWITSPDEARGVSNTEIEDLKREVFPLILRKCFENNPDLVPSFDEIFQPFIRPKIELLSKYPDLPKHSEKFHYLIPRSPILRFTLKRILIGGLSNLDSFKIRESNDIFTHTLLIKNVEGSMTLDYGREDESPMKMNFKIDRLFVMRKEETNCVCVQAVFWQIARAKGNILLNSHQSEVMINALESAIASSILPSMKIGNVCGMETPLEDIKITNTSEWKTVKEAYKEYIPFNDDSDQSLSEKFPYNVFNQ